MNQILVLKLFGKVVRILSVNEKKSFSFLFLKHV